MRSFEVSLRQGLALCLVMLLGVPAFAQQSAPSPQTGATSPQQPAAQEPIPPPAPSTSQPADTNQQLERRPAPTQQPSGNAAPVGTAAAPYEKGVGVAASRPAGVVIAPAKQRRTRSFLIKVGLVVGAAVAIGTVVALSNASPSEPSH